MNIITKPRTWLVLLSALFLLGCILYTAWPAFGVSVKSSWHNFTSPHIVCDEPVFDFAKADTGVTLTHTFHVRNDGWKTLSIKNVRTDCGCALASLPEKTIGAGKVLPITATLSLKGLRGKHRKNIVVSSDDPRTPHLQLSMEGVVTSEIEITPAGVNFGTILENAVASQIVEIGEPGRVSARCKFKITKALSSNEKMLNVRVEEISRQDAKAQRKTQREDVEEGYKLHVTLKGPMPRGRINEKITVSTDSAKEPEIVIPVTVMVAGELVVEPDKIILSAGNKQPATWWLAVTPGKTEKFTIQSVEAPGAGMQTEIIPAGDKQGYRIKLSRIVADKALHGQSVRIRTDVKGMEEILVPIQIVGGEP